MNARRDLLSPLEASGSEHWGGGKKRVSSHVQGSAKGDPRGDVQRFQGRGWEKGIVHGEWKGDLRKEKSGPRTARICSKPESKARS